MIWLESFSHVHSISLKMMDVLCALCWVLCLAISGAILILLLASATLFGIGVRKSYRSFKGGAVGDPGCMPSYTPREGEPVKQDREHPDPNKRHGPLPDTGDDRKRQDDAS